LTHTKSDSLIVYTQSDKRQRKQNPGFGVFTPMSAFSVPCATRDRVIASREDDGPVRFALALLLEKPPWWDVAWSTWGLLAVGVVATYLALKTLRDLKEQTKIARTAADAALKNAEAVIIAERAWIMVELEWAPGNARRMVSSSTTGVPIRLIYTNEGKTVAWIDEKLACFQIVKELPKQPDFGALRMLDNEPEWVGVKGGGKLDETLLASGQEGIVDISVIWGVIRYRDAFDTSFRKRRREASSARVPKGRTLMATSRSRCSSRA